MSVHSSLARAPVASRPPALVLGRSPKLRARVGMGLRTGGARRVLGGARVASDWGHLREMSLQFPGSPAFVDPTVPSGDLSPDPAAWFRRACPACPVLGYAAATNAEVRMFAAPKYAFATWLRPGVDDRLTTIGSVALRHAGAAEVRAVVNRVVAVAPSPARDLVERAVGKTIFPCSVEAFARDLVTNVRTLRWRCSAWGLPPPKRLLSLGRAYHVHRLARWSGAPPSVVAAALGFRDPSNYRRLVRTVLGLPPSEVVERGGPDYVASVFVEAVTSGLPIRRAHRPLPIPTPPRGERSASTHHTAGTRHGPPAPTTP